MVAVVAEALSKTYGKNETEVVALNEVSISVHEGEVTALLGPSGSGKSTLLSTLGLLLAPDRGNLTLGSRRAIIDGAFVGDTSRLRRERIGFVFQKPNLIPFLNAIDNVLLALEINDVRGGPARQRAVDLLGYLGLDERRGHMPDQLSGGQQQRVAIARALAMNPPLVLADEPTAALDSHRGRDVMELFRRIAKEQGAAVIVVTHDHRTLDVFDTIHEMEDGKLRTLSVEELASRRGEPSPARGEHESFGDSRLRR